MRNNRIPYIFIFRSSYQTISFFLFLSFLKLRSFQINLYAFLYILRIVVNERARLLATRGTLMKKPAAFRGLIESRNKSSSYVGFSTKFSPSVKSSLDISSPVSPITETFLSQSYPKNDNNLKDDNVVYLPAVSHNILKQNISKQNLPSLRMKLPKIHVGQESDIEDGTINGRNAIYSDIGAHPSMDAFIDTSGKATDGCISPFESDKLDN